MRQINIELFLHYKQKILKEKWITNDINILLISDYNLWTIAHEQARRGWRTNDPEILKIKDINKWTVAHEQAKNGYKIYNKEIWLLSTDNGWTVLHEMAKHGGIVTLDYNYLNLKTIQGVSVLNLLCKFYPDFLNHLPKKYRLNLLV